MYIKCRNFSLESGLGIESQRCVRLYLRDLHRLPIELKINWIGYRICSSCTLPCVKKHPRAKPYHCISHNDTSSNLDKTWCQQNAATHSIFKVKDCEHPMFAYWSTMTDDFSPGWVLYHIMSRRLHKSIHVECNMEYRHSSKQVAIQMISWTRPSLPRYAICRTMCGTRNVVLQIVSDDRKSKVMFGEKLRSNKVWPMAHGRSPMARVRAAIQTCCQGWTV